MKKWVHLLLALTFVSAVSAQQNDSIAAKMDAYLLAAAKLNRFNGNVLVAQNGKIVLQKSYGYKNFASFSLNDSNTIFQVASITKQFTAALILKLQEEGKLSVKDKLSKYFPELRWAGDITLENLLTHTSGIYNYTNDIDAADSAIVCNPVDKQLVLDIMGKHNLEFKPGSQFRYDNSGYYLLGWIIEKLTGIAYEQNVRSLIFAPLQMNHSIFDFRNPPDTNIATGYQVVNDSVQKIASAWRWDSTVSYAAGGIWSTTGDMYKWAEAMAAEKILSPSSWQAMETEHLGQYGYGLFIDTLYGERALHHGGGIPGFSADFCYFPGKAAIIILLTNQGWFDRSLDPVNAGLSAILFHKPYTIMAEHKATQLPDSILKKYVGQYDFDKKHHVYITLENNQLQIEAPQGGLPKSPLVSGTGNIFYLEIINAEIEFITGPSGAVIQLVARYKGKNEVCRKVKQPV